MIIGQFLEMSTPNKSTGQVLAVFDNRRQDKPGIAIRLGRPVEVFGERGVWAVGDAVLLKVARPHSSGHHLEISAERAAILSPPPASREFPLGNRLTLPGGRAVC